MKTLITTHKEYQELFSTGGCVIEESDKFKNEVNINTFNIRNGCWSYTFSPCETFSVLFRSSQLCETLYLVSTHDNHDEKTKFITNPSIFEDGSLIININNTENIVLKEHMDIVEKQYTHSLFPINKTDFEKCCQAKTMSIRLMVNDAQVGRDYYDISNLIFAFRTIWNKAIDNTKYSDSVVGYKKMLDAIIKKSNEDTEQLALNREKSCLSYQEKVKKENSSFITWMIIAIFGGLALFGFILLIV